MRALSRDAVILGDRTAAAVVSAARAGLTPRVVPVGSLVEVTRAVAALPADAPLLLTSPADRHPALVRAAAIGRETLGPGPDAVEAIFRGEALTGWRDTDRVRWPRAMTGVPATTRTAAAVRRALGRGSAWLHKAATSGRGSGVGRWSPWQPVRTGDLVQAYVAGETRTAVFRSDGWSALLLGVARSWNGTGGTPPFGYAGAIGPFDLKPGDRAALAHVGVSLTQRLDLRGLWAMELVYDAKRRWWPVVVHPRYAEAVEVLERASGLSYLDPKEQRRAADTANGQRAAHTLRIVDGGERLNNNVQGREPIPQLMRAVESAG